MRASSRVFDMQRQPLSESAQRRFDLVEARRMLEVQQPLHLRFLPSKPPGEVGLANAGRSHRLIQPDFGFRQGWHGDKPNVSAANLAWNRNLAPPVDVFRQNRQQRINSKFPLRLQNRLQ